MLDASFINAIEGMAVGKALPRLLSIPGDDRRLILARETGHEFIDVPKYMVAKMDRVQSVFDMAAERASEDLDADALETRGSRLFLSREKLVLVSDIDDRRERAVCDLKLTVPAAVLSNPSFMSQDEFVDFLRFHLAERIDKTIIDRVKAIRFKKIEEGASGTGHQVANASVSREVQIQSMTGGGEIPDLVPVMVRPFVTFDFEAEVTCALVINLERRAFMLKPIAEELDELFVQALDKIAALRTDKHPPLYFGKVNGSRSSDDE